MTLQEGPEEPGKCPSKPSKAGLGSVVWSRPGQGTARGHPGDSQGTIYFLSFFPRLSLTARTARMDGGEGSGVH